MSADQSSTIIQRSPDILVAAFASGAVAYDPVLEVAHFLGSTAAWLVSQDGPVDVGSLAHEAMGASGASLERVTADIVNGVAILRASGLLDRDDHFDPPPVLAGSSQIRPGSVVGSAHAVIDHRIAFRSTDLQLLSEIDGFLGMAVNGASPTYHFDVESEPDGSIRLFTEHDWQFPTREGFFNQLPGVLNDYGARSAVPVVVHAGAVRTPGGRVLLLPGAANAGKSTLTAALIRAGCDYLGDESIGVRASTLHAVAYPKPLTLDGASRRLFPVPQVPFAHVSVRVLRADAEQLVGDAGPIDEVLFPHFLASYPTEVLPLSPVAALESLMGNTLNLGRAGEAGLQALCDLAEVVPASRVQHGDARLLAERLVDGEATSPADARQAAPD